MAMKIARVDPGSEAEALGLGPGDELLSVDENELNDSLDYDFYTDSKSFHLKARVADGIREWDVQRAERGPFGCDFQTYLGDQKHSCSNHCMFCFIDQLPPGMRESLYFKDDDERLSFLFGNYITMTNMQDHEIDRIIKMHISPINISVHTTNPQLRVRMLANKRGGEVLKYLPRLVEGGIAVNCQLVLCRGINDGDELRRTLSDLLELTPMVQSIAAVPCGVTDYRKNLFPQTPYDAATSAEVIDIMEEFGDECKRRHGKRIIYPSDEWYLKAGRPIPPEEFYEDFDQLENGVGMMRLYAKEFLDELEKPHRIFGSKKLDVVTGEMASPLINQMMNELHRQYPMIEVTVHTIKNKFFGGNVGVAGLVTATDIIAQCEGKLTSGTLGVPAVMLREEKDTFLDDITTDQLAQRLGVKVEVLPDFRRRRSPRPAAQRPAYRQKRRDETFGGTPMSKPIVAVVGRPNVGKSTLFNKLCGQRLAIVEDTPGITRDRIFANCEWNGHDFLLVDTGGIEPKATEGILAHMREQAQIAIDTADCIIMVVDVRDGLTAADEDVAHMLRRSHKPIILAVNKCDKVGDAPMEMYEFYNLGFDEVMPISSVHGHGTGDLLDAVCAHLDFSETVVEEDRIPVAIIGRPNVGKSSLTNRILGENRMIVANEAGTTRDAIDTPVDNAYGKFIFTDTAGLRKRSNITDGLERYMVVRALAAVERSRVALILVDATVGFTEQDSKVAGYAHEQGKACIIVVNKWDAVEGKETNTMELQRRGYAECFSFMGYAPIIFISAQTGYNVNKLMQLIRDVDSQNGARVPTGVLNEMLARATARMQPPSDKGRRLKIFYLTQASTRPPTFVAFVNSKQLFHFSYQRYIINQIRENFGLEHTPIRLVVRERGSGEVGAKDV